MTDRAYSCIFSVAQANLAAGRIVEVMVNVAFLPYMLSKTCQTELRVRLVMGLMGLELLGLRKCHACTIYTILYLMRE